LSTQPLAVEEIADEVADASRDVRTADDGSGPTVRRAGFCREVLRVIESACRGLDSDVQLSVDGPIGAIPDEIAAHLVATLRDALANVARHAHARAVDVSIEASDPVVLRVADDGVGLSDDDRAGTGLRAMIERARQCGGRFRAVARNGGGTVVEWSVPNPTA
jgi:two-component system, NarL family, sensor histidine kinase DevS